MSSAERARVRVGAVFVLNGFAFAALVSRVPAVRDILELSVSQVGLLLLALSAGALSALMLSGAVVHRVGAAGSVLGGGLVAAAGLGVIGAGLAGGGVAPVAVGLAVYGAGTGTWDVAMNVEAADVEARLGRTVMPRFHAGYSIGTVGGALLGAAAAWGDFDLPLQLALVAVLCAGGVALSVREFLPATVPSPPVRSPDALPAQAPEGALLGSARAWREPRTLLIGLLVCAFAFIEGVANDWTALALVDGHGRSETEGALGFGLFVAAMTVGRLTGGSLLDRYGRVVVLRSTALLALAGAGTVIVADPLPLVLAGTVVWGIGASLGFPVGISVVADDRERAAARVAVVTSIGYAAFLAGPPVVGILAESVGILRALLVVVVAAAVGGLAAAAAAPPSRRLS